MALKKGLGRGLDALISVMDDTSGEATGKILDIDINLIEPNKNQPRQDFRKEELAELAESIAVYGVISPLVVKKEKDYYSIVAGERRWRAARIAGLKSLPVIVRELDEIEALEVALVENLQREDLNPVEEAISYRRLMDEFNMTQEDIAKRISKSRSAVANALRCLNLPVKVLELLREGRIQSGHAKVILGAEGEGEQERLALLAAEKGVSVRELERMVGASQAGAHARKRKKPERPEGCASMERELSGLYGTKIRIKPGNSKKGRVEIDYYSKDDLDRLYLLLRNIK